MTKRVIFKRNDALRMNVVAWREGEQRVIYEMIAQGWHPLDVAQAYGYLEDTRQLARILGSPLWKPRPERKMWAREPMPRTHYGQYYSLEDKQDAVWLIENGWHILDVAVMLGMSIRVRSSTAGPITDLYSFIRGWTRKVRRAERIEARVANGNIQKHKTTS